MPGNKRGRGRAGKAARYHRPAHTGASAPDCPDNPQAVASRYLPRPSHSNVGSMGDTLKHTNKNRTWSDKAGNLRSKPVRFVDAGVVEPLKELDQELCATNTPTQRGQNGVDKSTSIYQGSTQLSNQSAPPSDPESQIPDEDSLFFVDVTGGHPLSSRKAGSVHIPRPYSPKSDTDSGEDVVLFTGRKGAHSDKHHPTVTDEITIQVQQVEVDMRQISLDTSAEPASRITCSSPKTWQLRGHNDDDDIVADYIANMVDDDDDDDDDAANDSDKDASGHAIYQPFVNRSLGGSEDEFDMGSDAGSDDSLSTDEESDADNPEADKVDEFALDGASDIDDETLARLLAKQDELGLDDDELVLFSADGYAGTRPAGSGTPSARQGKKQAKSKGKGKGRQQTPSAEAVAGVFDELDLMDWGRHNPPRKPKSKRGQPAFNVSDSELEATLETVWQKDRLRKKERKLHREELRVQGLLGKHADPNDPRVKYPTHMTFDQIKEEMRAFLIGNEPSISFPPMDPHARKVIHELANRFNIKSKSAGSGDQRRPALHRTLRTVKYREVYFEDVFSRSGRKYFGRPDVKNQAPRNNGGSRGGRPGGGRGGGAKSAAFTYKDGEVVGASAPELGETNKGRTILEKMGWSTGMALGALDNKGILQPVAHVVKRTKAGLG